MASNSIENQIIVYGTTMCRDCIRSKKFLDSNQVSYKWINIEEDEAAVEVVLKLNNGMRSVPTIIFPDGTVMVEPSNQALGAKLAL